MNDSKQNQLRKHKWIATGLFLLMAIIFIGVSFLQKQYDASWLGYVKAFSEAAMVGALADWFAVTALFHHPLGLKIPHTNLIQKKKKDIGDNLGSFVVENFLSPQNIRPNILKLKVAHYAGDWLSKPLNQEFLIKEISAIITDVIQKLDDDSVVKFITSKTIEISENIKVNEMVSNGLNYILEQNDHQPLITSLASQVKSYVQQNQSLIQERVKNESHSLIPKFVDDVIANKITKGIYNYFDEVEHNPQHSIRDEISQKLYLFASELKTKPEWKTKLNTLKTNILKEEKLQHYSQDIWQSIKSSLIKELNDDTSPLKNYLQKSLADLSHNLRTDEALQHKIDHWIRATSYKYILKHRQRAAILISETVEQWEGKQLSEKLELEVGKDLQYIRINGTIVGGLVGLVIYSLAQWLL